MNLLTQVETVQKVMAKEQVIGITKDVSWHVMYKDSSYIYVGGLPFDLTEHDIMAIFAQCGEVVDVNLVKDKASGKSKGFAFLAFKDQQSTMMAVDYLNGSRVVGHTMEVNQIGDYMMKID